MARLQAPADVTGDKTRERIVRAAHLCAPAQVGWARDVTLVVVTFGRPQYIARYLESARQTFAALPIVVCEVGDQPLFAADVTLGQRIHWRHLPRDRPQTVGAARNHALASVQTPLFFLCDDDHTLGTHCELARMVSFMWRRQYDVAGGCQGPGQYGAAALECDSGILRQRFYAHHGLIEPGAVRCDRVSNGFMGRTATVSQVGWQQNPIGDNDADFFWRAKLAGLKVAQLSRTYVAHDRTPQATPPWWMTLLQPWVAQPDRNLAYLRLPEGANRLKASVKAYARKTSGLSALARHTRWRDKRAFLRLINQL